MFSRARRHGTPRSSPGRRIVLLIVQTFASFAHLREILDSCPYVTIVLNQQRQIVFFNRALVSLAGPVNESVLLGRKLAWRCSAITRLRVRGAARPRPVKRAAHSWPWKRV